MQVRSEPVLSDEDRRVWERWQVTFALHARTLRYRCAVDQARNIASDALSRSRSPLVPWSGGKDSTALAHLVRVGLGAAVPAVSEKDDLDYPGEEDYVRGFSAAWSLDLTIVRPSVSPMRWLLERRGQLSAADDMHSRRAGLSKACFYGPMDEANEGHDMLLWGLRAEESTRRRALLTRKGHTYQLKNGTWRCAPLAHWTGLDVFTYLQTNGIEPLHVYRCCGFLPEHRLKPWLIRKSWWIPGAHAAHGAAAWLKRYWPSLFAKLAEITYDARSFA